jgi:hypothetical protein
MLYGQLPYDLKTRYFIWIDGQPVDARLLAAFVGVFAGNCPTIAHWRKKNIASGSSAEVRVAKDPIPASRP